MLSALRWFGLVTLLGMASGCFAKVSDQFACGVDADCESGRVCDRGFCVIDEVAPDAAGRVPIDASAIDAPPDARPCAGGDAHASDADGTCFVVFRAAQTHAAAEARCAAERMTLASVKSVTANATVQSLVVGGDAYLGATDAVTEGKFLWPDGSGLIVTNFRAGEPNNGAGQFQEDCLVIEGANGGSWDDRPCDRALPFVCGF